MKNGLTTNEPITPLWTKNFVLLAGANLLLGIAFYFLLPILPLYLTDRLHISNRLIGVLMALFTISALLIRPLTGFWLDRFNRRLVYLCAFAGMVALFSLYPAATGIFSMALLRLAHGGAWGITSTASSTIVADVVPARRRGEGIGFFGLSMTLAMSLGPLLGMSIVKHLSYAALFYAGMGISLAGLVCATVVSYPRTVSPKRFKWSELLEPATIPISLVQLLLNLSYGGLLSYVAMFGKQIGVGNPGSFFLFFAIGMALSRLWSGKVFDRSGPAMVLRMGFLLLIVGFVALSFAHSTGMYLLSAFLIGTGNGIVMPSFQTMINAIVPQERRGAANSTFFAAFDVGIGAGMMLAGYLADKSGLRISFLVSAGAIVCSMFFLETFALRRYKVQLKHIS
jgi:predicted MFS family arabinose efflux permease